MPQQSNTPASDSALALALALALARALPLALDRLDMVCTVAVNENFTLRLCTTVVAWCERFREKGVLGIVPFYAKRRFRSVFTVSIPFHDRSPSEAPFH